MQNYIIKDNLYNYCQIYKIYENRSQIHYHLINQIKILIAFDLNGFSIVLCSDDFSNHKLYSLAVLESSTIFYVLKF